MLSPQDVLELAFSIVYDVEEYCLNFIAPTRYEVRSKGPLGRHTAARRPCQGTAGGEGSHVCPPAHLPGLPWGGTHGQGRGGLSSCPGLVPEMPVLCFPSSASGRMD